MQCGRRDIEAGAILSALPSQKRIWDRGSAARPDLDRSDNKRDTVDGSLRYAGKPLA
jgi:hypothetical protein